MDALHGQSILPSTFFSGIGHHIAALASGWCSWVERQLGGGTCNQVDSSDRASFCQVL